MWPIEAQRTCGTVTAPQDIESGTLLLVAERAGTGNFAQDGLRSSLTVPLLEGFSSASQATYQPLG